MMENTAEEYLKGLDHLHPIWDLEDKLSREIEYTEKQLIDFANEYHKSKLKNIGGIGPVMICDCGGQALETAKGTVCYDCEKPK